MKTETENLEKEILDKNKKLNELERNNEEFKIKLFKSEQNNKNMSNNEIELNQKLNNLNLICQKFETAYNNSVIDLERKQGEVEKFYKNLESKKKENETLKENMNKQIKKLKNENAILKKRENIYQDTISRYKQNNAISILS